MPLAHSIVSAPGASPARAILFLHGILGRGLNWRTLARELVRERPEWCAVLADLREHGDSRGRPPPHDLASAAADVIELASSIAVPARAILGHSFGGKVALACLSELGVDRAFIVDSLPGARPGGLGSEDTLRVLDMLAALPERFADRDAFVAHVRERGFSEPLARWLAMNLASSEGGYRFELDVESLRALLHDYFERDLWPVLDPPPCETHLIVGGRSRVFGADDLARARALADRHSSLRLHVLERAGHWVHVDDPQGLSAIVRGALP